MRFMPPSTAIISSAAIGLAQLLENTEDTSPRDWMASDGTLASTNAILGAVSESDEEESGEEVITASSNAYPGPVLPATTTFDADPVTVRPATPTDPSPRVLKWTVRNPGTIRVPTSDNYEDWRVDQLRKECVERGLKPKPNWTKAEHMERLAAYDEVHESVEATVDSENELPPAQRQSKNCCIRLMNILFSDRFARRFRYSGIRVTRAQMEAGTVHLNSDFWKDVTKEFQTNHSDYNGLFSDVAGPDPRYADIDPSAIVPHDTSKLFKMWMQVNKLWKKATERFRQSGTHDSDFLSFCEGRRDVAYLQLCVQHKPGLLDFVRGGMYEVDEIDTLKRRQPSGDDAAPAAKRWQSELLGSINRVTDMLVDQATPSILPKADTFDVVLDRIAKLHPVIERVKASIRIAEEEGRSEPDLVRSLAVYERCLRSFEHKLDVME